MYEPGFRMSQQFFVNMIERIEQVKFRHNLPSIEKYKQDDSFPVRVLPSLW